MRKIKLIEWDVDGNKPGEKVKEDLAIVLKAFLGTIPPQNMPRGFDQFRSFNKINKAFDTANKSRELVLENTKYMFIRTLINKFIPAQWSMKEERSEEVEKFMDLQAE